MHGRALPCPFTASACLTTSPLTLKTWPTADGGPPQKKRQDKSQLITLIDAQDKVSTTSLEQAKRLAKHRDLKLVKIEDPSLRKGSKEVYRLLTGKQYFEEEIRAKKSDKKASVGVKDEKILAIGGKISPHDLAVKLQSVTKWLSKGHQIKVTIGSRKATKEDKENVFSTIEEEVKKLNGRILQRHDKMEDVRFYIAPQKVREKEGVANSEPAQEGGGHVEGDKATDPTTV
ncbi:Translation initiation factor IF-3, mitochondrial [Chionoecetes opilio]|uniref:Translation initiation factor IF-3, mitochondrial n=1 Tax=Chionoecetes opilio TaxID=41210 RepID=A0A8J4YL10_CHIOP|nr:Translation initiation factor IF-3, mitochondrial [Chionoecetes opilio]